MLCARQRALIAQMQSEGRETTEAESVLMKLEDTLNLMRRLQQQLIEEARRKSR